MILGMYEWNFGLKLSTNRSYIISSSVSSGSGIQGVMGGIYFSKGGPGFDGNIKILL